MHGLRDRPIWQPPVRGGARVYSWNAAHWVRASRFNASSVLYMRLTPNRLLRDALAHCAALRVLELNGRDDANKPAFAPFLEHCDLLLVDTEENRRFFLERFGLPDGRVAVHPHPGADTRLFRPVDRAICRARLDLPCGAPVVVCVSGFQWHHDFATIVEAFSLLRREHPDAVLLLIGGGERLSEIRRACRNAPGIRFTGPMPTAVLPIYLGAADAAINLFTKERLAEGNLRAFKLYEYAAARCPTVEAVDDSLPVPPWAREGLWIVPAGDPGAVAGALGRILANPDMARRKAAAARDYVVRYRSWESVTAITLGRLERAQSAKMAAASRELASAR